MYVFNDWHGLMIFALAGRADLVEQVLEANELARPYTTNHAVLQRAGLDLLAGSRHSAARITRRPSTS